MISISNLGKAYGDRALFAGASFQLNPGERYGLVGANGSGKTTFLGILAGDLDATAGTVSIPKRLRVGVLRQDQFLYEDESILATTLMGNPELWEAMVEREALLSRAGEHFDADRYSVLEETFQRFDGYTAESRAATILEGLGIPTSQHQNPMRTLSGGFKLRVLLAQVLASAPDVLFLDEPTNHLDILSIRWLETFLCDFTGPLVVISHDHRFLDNVATHILDVDYGTVQLYHGNYSHFLEAKVEERDRRERDISNREKEIAQQQRFVDRFKAKASKARQAQSKARMIEKMADSIEELAPSSRRYPTFLFQQKRPSGKEVLKVKGVRKSFGSKEVLHGVDLTVNRGDRLAILGPNGIGKSTLLKIVMGELAADAGEVEWGYETHPGYFAQDHHEELGTLAQTAEDWIWTACPDKDLGFVRGRLALMLFSGDDPKKRLDSLSGGEAARLVFAKLAIERPNVLVLDEPTNHLDLESIEALVEGLQKFEGTLVLVSHDRWFVGQLATRVVEIRADGILDYLGTYDEYVHFCGDDHLDAERVLLKAKGEKKGRSGDGGPGSGGGSGVGSGGSATAGGKATAGSERTSGKVGGVDHRGGTGTPVDSRLGGSQGGGGRAAGSPGGAVRGPGGGGNPVARKRELSKRHEALTGRIDAAEGRVREIEELFAQPTFYERSSPEEVRALEAERARIEADLAGLMEEWEEVEGELYALE